MTAGHRLGGLFGWAVVKVLTLLLETKPAVFHRTTSHADASPIGHERPLHLEDLIDPSSVALGLAVLAVMLDG